MARLPGLAAASAAIAIAAFSGLLPASLAFIFKPLTTLLVIAHAWPRGAAAPRQQRLIRIGLMLSLAGDVFLLWPRQGFLPGLVSFLLAHLAYIAAFCVPLRFAARPAIFAAYGALAAAIMCWPTWCAWRAWRRRRLRGGERVSACRALAWRAALPSAEPCSWPPTACSRSTSSRRRWPCRRSGSC
jgi:hypothetical protein